MSMPCVNTLQLDAYLRELDQRIINESRSEDLTGRALKDLLAGKGVASIAHDDLVEAVCIHESMPRILIEAGRNPGVAGQMLANLTREIALGLVTKHMIDIERKARADHEEEKSTRILEERWYG